MLLSEHPQGFCCFPIVSGSVLYPADAPVSFRPLRRRLSTFCNLTITDNGLVKLLLIFQPHPGKQGNLPFLLRRKRRRGQGTRSLEQFVPLPLPEIDTGQPHRGFTRFRSAVFDKRAERLTSLVILLEPNLRDPQLQPGFGAPGWVRIRREKLFEFLDRFSMEGLREIGLRTSEPLDRLHGPLFASQVGR